MSFLSRILGAGVERVDPPRGDAARIAQVQAVIETIRPMLDADGGDVRLVSVEDGEVRVKLVGACRGCYASPMTVQGVLEPKLREELEWVRSVRAE